MKLSQILYRQHIGFMFKKHWLVQGKKVPIETGVEQVLKARGIPVEDALEFVKEKPEKRERIQIIGPFETPAPLDETHPEYKDRPCYTLKSNNLLLEGLSQAQILTKTVVAENRLPSRIEELAEVSAPKAVHENVKKAILSANIFDCEQKKLPKIKDPERPAYNFPRILGITDKRRNQILTNRLVQIVERCNDTESTLSRLVLNDIQSHTVFDKEDDLIQFQDISNILVTSNKPISYETESDIAFVEIPDLYPIKHTITLPKEHFYDEYSKYPIQPSVSMRHPHTTWLHINSTEVGNIYETPPTPTQIYGRALTHAFTVAAAYAKQLYGEEIKDLPVPIYVNCIQTNGQKFHFGVFELKTLNLDGTEGTKNVWYCKNDMKMYDSSRYFSGLPVLENYNPKVYGYINALYNC
ncbi:large ribosomal subunit protein mL37 [Plodia interpunctella]|uniref:large ribosomal subunit protein mL37 n=1 Tax=Plodia interpunctella TaxID=58824 RepID=UPI002367F7C9|nr:39S ribosomal protein L37, mitochondrial [Plodia interpunctella]